MSDDTLLLTRLEAEVRHMAMAVQQLGKTQDMRWERIEPVLLARSGDLVRADEMKGDINSLGEKVRGLDRRVAGVEKRQDRTTWILLGGVAVIQFLFNLFGPYIKELLR